MQWPQGNLISGAAKNVAKANSNKLKQIARPYIMSASSNPVALKSNAIKNLLHPGSKYSVAGHFPDLSASQPAIFVSN
jgi:phospholipase/lecithinase/hemolysin